MSITFQTQDISFNLRNKRKIKKWINSITLKYQKELGNVNYILCSNDYILNLNQKYLNHNYYTDIITFDYCEKNIIEGDIFVCIDTVKDNSKRFKTNFEDELLRVIIHGILHLIGFNDKSLSQQKKMRALENDALSIYYSDAD